MSAPASPIIALRGVSKVFTDSITGERLPVLQDISLEVFPGEFICLVGPSGCGKSTLLNIVAGFERADAGQVLVEGAPVTGPVPDRIFVFQECAVFPWLTVAENIAVGLGALSPGERREVVAHYVAMTSLTGFEGCFPRQLSGGMRQRVELARALAARPRIIYMDEPFGALDYLTRMKMRGDLTRLWQQERATILFVTHDIEEALQLADRVVVLTARPAALQHVIPIDVGRPRDLDDPRYLDLRDQIFHALGVSLRIGDD